MRLELNHLVEGYSVACAATMQPKVEDGLSVDAIRLANFIIVQRDSHEFLVSD